MPTIALSTGSLHTYGIARTFELAAKVGFEAVELLVDHRWDSRHPSYLQRLCRETGLSIVAVHNPFMPHVPGWPAEPEGRLRESVALARGVGARVVVTHLPLRFRAARVELWGFKNPSLLLPIFLPYQEDYRRFLLNGLGKFEAEEGVLVGVENMPARRFLGRRANIYYLNDPETLASLPHLTLDTTHIGTWGLDLLDVYERLKERIVHIHLSNFNGQEHRLVEDGHLPLGQLLEQLTKDGYRGAVSLEFGPVILEAEDEGRAVANLRRALDFCLEHT